jgi:hypothetical protein
MIDYALDADRGILLVHPDDPLSKEDFATLSSVVDPFLDSHGKLAGLVIDAPSFPGWTNFAALMAHFRFVHDHHRLIRKVAIVTDSKLGDFAEHLASHFVAAEIKHFPAGDVDTAQQWIHSNA